MKFGGKCTLSELEIADLTTRERLCTECMLPFVEGDRVAVFTVSRFQEGRVVVTDELFLVHVDRKSPAGGSCLEDFIVRRLQHLEPDVPASFYPLDKDPSFRGSGSL